MGVTTCRHTSILTPALSYSYEHGINTFDTADMYSNGLSEKILGRAIKQLNLPREEIVVLTKVRISPSRRTDTNTDDVQKTYFPWSRDSPTNLTSQSANADEIGLVNQWGLSRKHIFDSVKASLERLQLDYIDVLQCMLPVSYVHGTVANDNLTHRPSF